MKKTLLALLIASSAHAAPVTLDGEHTTAADIAAIARGETVAIADSAQARVEKSFAVLLAAAKTGQPIYGFTVGVGWNKDRTFVTMPKANSTRRSSKPRKTSTAASSAPTSAPSATSCPPKKCVRCLPPVSTWC